MTAISSIGHDRAMISTDEAIFSATVEREEVVAPLLPLNQLTEADAQFVLPAIQAYKQVLEEKARIEQDEINAVANVNFVLSIIRLKPEYQLTDTDRIDEDGIITRI